MTYPIQTRILIDGIEAADTADDLAAGEPTVLDQLQLTWGRSSPVDQPEVGSCSFTMREQLQEPIPEAILATNHAPDPSFEYGFGGFSAGGDGTLERSDHSHSGLYSIKLTTGSGIYNPVLTVRGANDERLNAGDQITVRAWVWMPTLTAPFEQWSRNRGTTEIIYADDGTPILEWTATEDQTVNTSMVASPNAVSADDLVGTIKLRKGNAQAPDSCRVLVLCYDSSNAYLGVAALPGIDNQHIVVTDEWSELHIPKIEPIDGTVAVRLAVYGRPVGLDDFKIGDKIQVSEARLYRPGRPQLRVGGNGVEGRNSATFTGPYNTWTPIEVTTSAHSDDSTLIVYAYGSDTPGEPVWYDDLTVMINEYVTDDFSGDTPPDDPGALEPNFHHQGGFAQHDRYESWPMLQETPTGTWLLAYKSSGSHVPHTPGRSMVQRSTDQGLTWDLVASIGETDVSVGGFHIAVGTDGSLTLVTVWNTSGLQGANNDSFRTYRSTDDGLTWTYHATYHWEQVATLGGPPITLANGDLLVAWHGRGWGTLRSTDNGLSWTLEMGSNGGRWGREGQIVQATDGTLILTARNNRFDLMYSYDNGHNWTRAVDTEITPPPPANSGGNTFTHAMSIFKQWIEIVWVNRADQRLYYTYGEIGEVLDDPTAWRESVELTQLAAAGPGDLGYPSMLHRDNGALYIVWYADPSRDNTPGIYTGVCRLETLPGPGDHYRWLGVPGDSPSQKFRHSISQTPILDALHTGSTVAVWAKAGDIPPVSDQVMTETQFHDRGTLHTDHWASSTNPTIQVYSLSGRQAAWISNGVQPWTGQVVFPPAPYPPEGFEPDAWDDLPRLLPEQTWQLSITAMVPIGAEVQLTAWAVTDPHRSAVPTVCLITTADDEPWDAPQFFQWRTLTGLVALPPGTDASWIVPGVQVDAMPSPQRWQDMQDAWVDHPRIWGAYSMIGISEIQLHQTAHSARDMLVWSGHVNTVTAQAAGDHAVTIEVGAVDPSGRLNNETVGEPPWPVHTVKQRVDRILRLSRYNPPAVVIDPDLASYRLTRRDVDAQPVLGLLHDVATSAGGVLWVAEHATLGATYLWLEDPTERASVRAFVIENNMMTITGSSASVALLSAGDVLYEPLQLAQDTTSVITSVDVSWQQQGTDDEGQPTTEEKSVTRTDDRAVDRFGMQKLSISTELIDSADAADLADRHLARARTQDWEFTGVSVDGRVMERPLDDLGDSTRLATMSDILDGTRRLGLPITILDLPDWMAASDVASGYLEGGTYTLNDGRWDVDLTITPAAAQGDSATWEQIPAVITWAQVDPLINWADAYGVAAPETGEVIYA